MTSFHLWWGEQPADPVTEVSATFAVIAPPAVDRLYFWALQASFFDGLGTAHGAAHGGFQWNPFFGPTMTAVNWGGYREASDTGTILAGSVSPLPSAPNDPNTRDYPWQAGREYRFRISRGTQGWAFDVTDLASGATVRVRELFAGGDRLGHAVVWAEVFSRCDDPPTAVRWSELQYRTRSGATARPRTLLTNFPPYSAGDCTNTDSRLDGAGAVLQLTNTNRTAVTAMQLAL